MLLALAVVSVSGCGLFGRYTGTTAATATDATDATAATTSTASKSLLANKSLNLSPNISLPYESMLFWAGYTAIAYMVLDPLAPNWEIQQAAFPDQHVLINLKMKRMYSGGAGEARQIFQRRAAELMRKGGFDGYQIVEYSESLESSMLGSQRVAQGVVKLTHTEG